MLGLNIKKSNTARTRRFGWEVLAIRVCMNVRSQAWFSRNAYPAVKCQLKRDP